MPACNIGSDSSQAVRVRPLAGTEHHHRGIDPYATFPSLLLPYAPTDWRLQHRRLGGIPKKSLRRPRNAKLNRERDPNVDNLRNKDTDHRAVENRLEAFGETTSGRTGKKNLCALKGRRKPTPSPPSVIASSSPCEAVPRVRTRNSRHHVLE